MLSKINICLKGYIEDNNTKYKRNIDTIFMNKEQLKNFYYDMRNDLNVGKTGKDRKNEGASIRINKWRSISVVNKENKVSDWKNASKTKMNELPLISNCNEVKVGEK